jgi:deoxyhypusine synthase
LKTPEFEELKSLNLRECATVGEIVSGMRNCAFGARMLGEVAHTIRQMIESNEKQIITPARVCKKQMGSEDCPALSICQTKN